MPPPDVPARRLTLPRSAIDTDAFECWRLGDGAWLRRSAVPLPGRAARAPLGARDTDYVSTRNAALFDSLQRAGDRSFVFVDTRLGLALCEATLSATGVGFEPVAVLPQEQCDEEAGENAGSREWIAGTSEHVKSGLQGSPLHPTVVEVLGWPGCGDDEDAKGPRMPVLASSGRGDVRLLWLGGGVGTRGCAGSKEGEMDACFPLASFDAPPSERETGKSDGKRALSPPASASVPSTVRPFQLLGAFAQRNVAQRDARKDESSGVEKRNASSEPDAATLVSALLWTPAVGEDSSASREIEGGRSRARGAFARRVEVYVSTFALCGETCAFEKTGPESFAIETATTTPSSPEHCAALPSGRLRLISSQLVLTASAPPMAAAVSSISRAFSVAMPEGAQIEAGVEADQSSTHGLSDRLSSLSTSGGRASEEAAEQEEELEGGREEEGEVEREGERDEGGSAELSAHRVTFVRASNAATAAAAAFDDVSVDIPPARSHPDSPPPPPAPPTPPPHGAADLAPSQPLPLAAPAPSQPLPLASPAPSQPLPPAASSSSPLLPPPVSSFFPSGAADAIRDEDDGIDAGIDTATELFVVRCADGGSGVARLQPPTRSQVVERVSLLPHRVLAAEGGGRGGLMRLALTDDVDAVEVTVERTARTEGQRDGEGREERTTSSSPAPFFSETPLRPSAPALAYVAAGRSRRRFVRLAPSYSTSDCGTDTGNSERDSAVPPAVPSDSTLSSAPTSSLAHSPLCGAIVESARHASVFFLPPVGAAEGKQVHVSLGEKDDECLGATIVPGGRALLVLTKSHLYAFQTQ